MANLAIYAGFSVNGVARLHTEILKNQELKDFYEMMPEKFNNKTNGITQRRFLLHGDPLLAEWVSGKIGSEWITDLSQIKKLEIYADDPKCQAEFMNIKYQNKLRLAKYIKEHNGIDVDPRSIFDVQVKRSVQSDQGTSGDGFLPKNIYLWSKGGSRIPQGKTYHQTD